MPLNDHLVRIITASGTVRALACNTTGLVAEAAERHGAGPVASAALGRALTGAALMGALLKTGQRVALKFEGNGPLRKVIVEAESNGAVRGFVAVPDVDLPLKSGKLDVAAGIGRAGFLTVTKDLGLKEPYQGIVQLYSSEIAEDLAFYLTDSEQTPSAVGLSVFVDGGGAVTAAGGFLIQALPPGDPELVETLMTRIDELPPLSELFLTGTTPEALLQRLFDGIPHTLLEKRALAFNCTCTREKIERVLCSLGSEDLGRLVSEREETEVTCEFCRQRYTFDRREVAELLANLDGEGSP